MPPVSELHYVLWCQHHGHTSPVPFCSRARAHGVPFVLEWLYLQCQHATSFSLKKSSLTAGSPSLTYYTPWFCFDTATTTLNACYLLVWSFKKEPIFHWIWNSSNDQSVPFSTAFGKPGSDWHVVGTETFVELTQTRAGKYYSFSCEAGEISSHCGGALSEAVHSTRTLPVLTM